MTQTTAERMAMIHEVALKLRAKKAQKERLSAVRKRTLEMKNALTKKSGFVQYEQSFDVPADNDSETHWSDGSKYAKKYYGNTLFETTRFDNEWGDY